MNILVVDDDPFIREALKQHIASRFGYRVFCVPDSQTGWDALHDESWDLVLLDVHLGDHDSGFDFLERIRHQWSTQDLPVMMVTSLESSKNIVSAFDLGANEYVTKPLDMPVVLARIQNLLRPRSQTPTAQPTQRDVPKAEDTANTTGDTADHVLPCEVPIIAVVGSRSYFCKTSRIGRQTLRFLTFEAIPKETVYHVQMIDPQGNDLDLKVLETDRQSVGATAQGTHEISLRILDRTEWYDAFYAQIFAAFNANGEAGLLEALRGAHADPNDPTTKSMPGSLLFQTAPMAKRLAGGVRYQFERLLGSGGFASVFLVRDLALKRPVAMKVLDAEYAAQPALRKHFLKEAQIAAQFHHPHIAFVYEVGEFIGAETQTSLDFPEFVLENYPDRFIYFTMQYVDGKTLGDEIEEQGQVKECDGINILIDVASALDFAHAKGVVHRDIKPENIMIDADGQIIVTDFGTATLTPTSDNRHDETIDTQSGDEHVAFTPSFASPEQFLGQDIDGRSDIYSLGATAYKMFTGHPPFTADTIPQLLEKHLHQNPPSFDTHGVSVGPTLENAILTCLAKNPDERFQSAGALREQLEQTKAHASPELGDTFDDRLTDLLDEAVLGTTTDKASAILDKLIALIRVHKNSSQPDRIERIRSAVANPQFLNTLVERNLNRENRGLLFQFIQELASSSVAFVLLQHFQMETQSWKKEFLAKLAVLSSRANLQPLVLFGKDLPDHEAVAMLRAFAATPDVVDGGILSKWAEHQGAETQMALLDLCFQTRHQTDDAREIIDLFAAGVGSDHSAVQTKAADLLRAMGDS